MQRFALDNGSTPYSAGRDRGWSRSRSTGRQGRVAKAPGRSTVPSGAPCQERPSERQGMFSATLRTSRCESRPTTAEKSSRILTVHPICGDAPETQRALPCVLRQIAHLHARRGAMQSCMRQTATGSDWSVDNFNRCAKHVPDPALSKDVAWVRRIGLELASQPHDLRVDGTIVDVVAVKAGHVEELVAR